MFEARRERRDRGRRRVIPPLSPISNSFRKGYVILYFIDHIFQNKKPPGLDACDKMGERGEREWGGRGIVNPSWLIISPPENGGALI